MSIVKLDLASLTLLQKIDFALRVVDAMAANEATFPDAPVTWGDFQDMALALSAAANNTAAARAQLRELVTLEADLQSQMDVAFTQIARYVQTVSGGLESTIALAGMTVRNAPSPVGPLPMVRGLTVVNGPGLGELVLRWKPLRGARSYVMEQTTDESSPASWTRSGASTKAKASVNGLTSGTKYWFRVAAVGAAGQGAWSDAIGRVAG